MKPSIKYLISSLFLIWGFEAFSQPFQGDDKFRLGVQMGLNVSTITGTELESPKSKTGMVIGAYYRQKLSEDLQLKTEIAFSLRGARFDFKAENYYNAIKFTCMDFPVELLINTSGKNQNQFAVFGFEPSYLLQSEIYVNPDFRPRYRNYGLKRFDLAAIVGYHFDFYYMGIQPSVKFGLININNNMDMPTVLPATGKDGSIKNFTFDLKFYF